MSIHEHANLISMSFMTSDRDCYILYITSRTLEIIVMMSKPSVAVGKTVRKTPEGKFRVGHEPPETSRQVYLLHHKIAVC